MNSTNHHALAVLATFLIGGPTANLSGAAFSNEPSAKALASRA